MSARDVALADFRKAVAGILNFGMEGLSDDGKILLAGILQNDPGSLRIHVRLEPFQITGAVFAADRATPPVELFTIHGDLPSGAFQ